MEIQISSNFIVITLLTAYQTEHALLFHTKLSQCKTSKSHLINTIYN